MASSSSTSSSARPASLTSAKDLRPSQVEFLRKLKECSRSSDRSSSGKANSRKKFSDLGTSRKSTVKGLVFAFLQDIKRKAEEGKVDEVLKGQSSRKFLEKQSNSSFVQELGLVEALSQLRSKHAADKHQQRMNSRMSVSSAAFSNYVSDSRAAHHQAQQHANSNNTQIAPAAANNDDDVQQSSMDIDIDHSDHAADDDLNSAEERFRLENEVLPNSIGIVQLTDAQLAILSKTHERPKFTIKRLIQHFAVQKRWPHADSTAFLKMVRNNAIIGLDSEQFPMSSKTLLKIEESLKAFGAIRTLYASPALGSGIPQKTGTYLHFGIKSALLAKSPGLVNKWQYIKTMRTVHTLFPEVIPNEIMEIIRPQPGEECDREMLKFWTQNPPKPHDEGERDIVLNIHGHIDGVQWFANSTQSKGVPILGRLISMTDLISGTTVKIPDLDPFVIGVLHVLTTTNTKEFVKDFVEELRELLFPEVSGVSFTVRMVALICDAPQRAECKGTVFFNGYYSCERCKVKGEAMVVPGTGKKVVRFPDLECDLRSDDEWATYKMPEERNSKYTHRKPGVSSIFEAEDGRVLYDFKHIAGVPLESMHLLDGGVIKNYLEAFIDSLGRCPIDKKNPNAGTRSIVETEADKMVTFLKEFSLTEQARKLRPLESQSKWKMRENHVFFMYYSYFVFEPFADRLYFGKQFLQCGQYLLLALHLTKGFSMEPIPEERLTRAQEAIEMFLNGWMTNAFGPQGMTYKFHSLVHMLDDCRNHGCHLEFLAAYIYENFHMQWGSFIRSGNLPVSQIRNRLCEMHKYLLPMDPETCTVEAMPKFNKDQLEHMKKNHTLELPAGMFDKAISKKTAARRNGNTAIEKLKYEGFKLSTEFPQNICLTRGGNIVFCDKFEKVEGCEKPVICGYAFQKGIDVFDDPYESRQIGWVRVWDLSLTQQRWCASDVVSKCYCFPNSMSQRSYNPLPNSIRKEKSTEKRTMQFNRLFDKSDVLTWNIVPLLHPPDIVLTRIARFIDNSQS